MRFGYNDQRLIPAHAGKTGSTGSFGSCGGAHPRSRGENESARGIVSRHTGSSPLTRGKPVMLGAVVQFRGLIPAHAGKTHAEKSHRRRPPAHPRSRGENCMTGANLSRAGGSSPLTRGKHRRPHPRRQRVRLIPAHAGKTCREGERPPCRTAHPRSRGENRARRRAFTSCRGSSPLTRGKRDSRR